MNDPFLNLHLKSLRISREITLQARPNLIGDLIITQRRAQSHLIDHWLGRHRSCHRQNLSACRLCIDLSSQDHDLGVIMHRYLIRSVFDLLLNRSTDGTGVRSHPLVLLPPPLTWLTRHTRIALGNRNQAHDIEHYHERK
jgi:hypothetical protein